MTDKPKIPFDSPLRRTEHSKSLCRVCVYFGGRCDEIAWQEKEPDIAVRIIIKCSGFKKCACSSDG